MPERSDIRTYLPRRLMAAALGAVLFLPACGATRQTQDRDYVFKNYYRGASTRELLSKEKMDNRPSYEVFFSLEKPEECIRITVSARNRAVNSTFMDPSVRACFVVEKVLDVARFNLRTGNTLYVEMGRNYDINWKPEREAVVCTVKDFPLKKLTPGLYRIRLTSFEAADFSFSIAIASNEAQAIVAATASGDVP